MENFCMANLSILGKIEHLPAVLVVLSKKNLVEQPSQVQLNWSTAESVRKELQCTYEKTLFIKIIINIINIICINYKYNLIRLVTLLTLFSQKKKKEIIKYLGFILYWLYLLLKFEFQEHFNGFLLFVFFLQWLM